jgi:carboxyl-terminal processing protease
MLHFKALIAGRKILYGCLLIVVVSWPMVSLAKTAQLSTDSVNLARDHTLSKIELFEKSAAIIKSYYVDKITTDQILDNAIHGMLSNLDPHSEYLDKDDYKNLLLSTQGEFSGLGIHVTPKYGSLVVISPLDGSPAAEAGIKAGDFLLAINGKLVSEMSLAEAINSVRGPQNSLINLTIMRKDNHVPFDLRLKRAKIHLNSVRSSMLLPGFGYIRISQFQRFTDVSVKSAIKALQYKSNNHLHGIILDLRNNPGGLLRSAVATVDLLLDSQTLQKFNKIIVYTVGKAPNSGWIARARGHDCLKHAPIVVLINNGSASAAEIVAGALQDYKRALIVGNTSFGKGSVQEIIPLDATHAIKLTTALYHTPAGKVIQNIGIVPDINNDAIKFNVVLPRDISILEPLKEYQLKNHLGNTRKLGNEQNQALARQQATLPLEVNLASQDYALYNALELLQAMYYSRSST